MQNSSERNSTGANEYIQLLPPRQSEIWEEYLKTHATCPTFSQSSKSRGKGCMVLHTLIQELKENTECSVRETRGKGAKKTKCTAVTVSLCLLCTTYYASQSSPCVYWHLYIYISIYICTSGFTWIWLMTLILGTKKKDRGSFDRDKVSEVPQIYRLALA